MMETLMAAGMLASSHSLPLLLQHKQEKIKTFSVEKTKQQSPKNKMTSSHSLPLLLQQIRK